MKKFLILVLAICATSSFAQDAPKQTNKFTISGVVKKGSVITMDSLKQYATIAIGDIKITDHTGGFKHKDGQLKGVLLTDVLSHTKFDVSSPKLLSTLYFQCVGVDGYRVVYSWNELYNTEVGKHVFIITEKNGIKAADMKESLQMTSSQDFKTGRRYLHNLDQVIVSQAK